MQRIQYSDGISIGGRPASLWSVGEDGKELSAYRYAFSARKLALSILGWPLGSSSEVELPVEGLLQVEEPAVMSRAVVLVHGLLCSRLDMAHIAEDLCRRGFSVLAPEMDDSVSHETELQCEYVGLWHALACKKGHGNVETTRSWSTLVTSSMLGDHALQLVLRSLSALVQEEGIVPGGFVGSLLAREDAEERRLQVLQEAISWLRARGANEVGLVGHSRGGVTISQLEGCFCRVNIAGFQPPQVDPEDIFRANALGPMLIICGSEDEVCTRPPLSMKYVQETVQRLRPEAESFYPSGVTHFNLLNPKVVETWRTT
ncbi:unnamed protein product, partial [Durusdinium trenchii]